AKKEGCEPSHLEQFRFQYLRKDKSDKLSSEAVEQVYAKDSMQTPGSSFVPQDNVAMENELYTQVFGLDKYGKVLGYRREMNAKHVEQIQTIQAEQVVRENALLKEAKSRFRAEAVEREARLISEVE
ncbi:hypothetical protein Gotri_000710, partial [Gossypium trilobum]|nr:hypothetical protein [Gossypium trilobum]